MNARMLGHRVLWTIAWIFKLANGEFILEFRANGGGVIALRSIWSAVWFFAIAIGVYSFLYEKAEFSFSSTALIYFAREKFEWFGAIFVAIYVALYSRFAAQWSYLACLFNQITQSRAESLGAEDKTGESSCEWAKKLGLTRKEEHYAMWMAAFVTDAFELHLARKDIFVECVNSMLAIRGVRPAFLDASEEHKTMLREFRSWYVRQSKLDSPNRRRPRRQSGRI